MRPSRVAVTLSLMNSIHSSRSWPFNGRTGGALRTGLGAACSRSGRWAPVRSCFCRYPVPRVSSRSSQRGCHPLTSALTCGFSRARRFWGQLVGQLERQVAEQVVEQVGRQVVGQPPLPLLCATALGKPPVQAACPLRRREARPGVTCGSERARFRRPSARAKSAPGPAPAPNVSCPARLVGCR